MALLTALNNAVSGLNTINDSIDVTADNIANAQTESYHRRRVAVEDAPESGSRIARVVRETNAAMQKAFRASLSRSAASGVRNEVYTEIADILSTPDGVSRLSRAINQFVSGWRELQSAPDNEAVPYKIQTAAQEVASLMRELHRELGLMRREINDDIRLEVANLNNLLNDVDVLNNKIMSHGESSSVRSAFENERDSKLDQIAKIVDITVQRNVDGGLSVYTKTGVSLISGVTNQFSWDGTRQMLDSDLSSRNLINELPEGSLGARIKLIRNYEDAAVGNVEASDANLSPLQKIEDQINALAKLLTQPSSTSKPTTFAGAYGAAAVKPVNEPAYPGPYNAYWENQLFVPGDLGDDSTADITALNFFVNPNLVRKIGEMGQNTDAVAAIVSNLTSHNRRVDLKSMTLEKQNYEDVVKAIQVNFSIRNERIHDLKQANLSAHNHIATTYRSAVGVSLDQEMARVTVLQNSYAATAKVITTINNMFAALERAV